MPAILRSVWDILSRRKNKWIFEKLLSENRLRKIHKDLNETQTTLTLNKQTHAFLFDAGRVDDGAWIHGRIARIRVEYLQVAGFVHEIMWIKFRYPNPVLGPRDCRLRIACSLAQKSNGFTLGHGELCRRVLNGWRDWKLKQITVSQFLNTWVAV